MTIRSEIPPVCSECGMLLPNKTDKFTRKEENRNGDSCIVECTKCRQLTDIEARLDQDLSHRLQHESGKDLNDARFIDGKWIGGNQYDCGDMF